MRRFCSVALLCMGVVNLIWLNRVLYPRYQASQLAHVTNAAEAEFDPTWMTQQLQDLAPVLTLAFEEAGYLPKTSLAQVRHLALELARASDNYWVQIRMYAEPKAPGLTDQAKQRCGFIRDLLVQSGLRQERVLIDVAPAASLTPSVQRRVEIRVLEVQSQ